MSMHLRATLELPSNAWTFHDEIIVVVVIPVVDTVIVVAHIVVQELWDTADSVPLLADREVVVLQEADTLHHMADSIVVAVVAVDMAEQAADRVA